MTPPPSPSEPDREAAIHAAISELIAQIEPAFEAVDHPRNGENKFPVYWEFACRLLRAAIAAYDAATRPAESQQ